MANSAAADSPRATAQTLDRGLRVLEAVARTAPAPATVAAIAAALGINRTVVHRLAATLVMRGYLQKDGGGYRLGSACVSLASAVADLKGLARPHLEQLALVTGETVALAVLSGHDVVFVDGIESAKALRVANRAGRRLPAHSTSVGKALLATLEPERLRELYPDSRLPAVTPKTISTRKQLERELQSVRVAGYATNDGESEVGVGSVGMVVRTPANEPRAAFSVAMPLTRLTDDAIQAAVEALKATTAKLGSRLP